MTAFRTLSLVVLLAFTASACSTVKKATPDEPVTPDAPTAIGVWDYTILGTPQGDAGGVMTLVWADDAYTGEMTSDLLFQTVDVEEFVLVDDQANFKATFDMEGSPLPTKVAATLNGDTLVGKIEVPGFGTFDFEAARRSPNP
ncbi:MAG: hypothetical protein RhofKO_20910 [Rhodothermales bacterium]